MEYSQARNLDHATRSIPLKVTLEILSRLPAKSIFRFQTVSKLWRLSTIQSKDFAKAFLTRSRARPRLLFTYEPLDSQKLFIFSAPEHDKDKDDKVVARHDMTISDLGYYKTYSPYYNTCPPVNGLMCFMRGSSIVVCNPTTRQSLTLLGVRANGRVMHARLGYDPVGDEYKVLCVMMFDGHKRDIEQEHRVFSLRSEHRYWRTVDTRIGEPYTDVQGGICMNGAIYYGVGHTKIARFDVRSEKLTFIQAPKDDMITSWNFINQFGGIEYDYLYGIKEKELLLNNMTCVVPCEWGYLFTNKRPSCPGEQVMFVSHGSESSKPFSVFYCDVIQERGTVKHDEDILCFPGYIENIMSL